tara:strand:- start:77 stop:229 length:153 start_codon:yes stop_codon:yes gene_type:complete
MIHSLYDRCLQDADKKTRNRMNSSGMFSKKAVMSGTLNATQSTANLDGGS